MIAEAESKVTCAASALGVVGDIYASFASKSTVMTEGKSAVVGIGGLAGSSEYWVTCAPEGSAAALRPVWVVVILRWEFFVRSCGTNCRQRGLLRARFVWRGVQRNEPVLIATILVTVEAASPRGGTQVYHNAVAVNVDVLAPAVVSCGVVRAALDPRGTSWTGCHVTCSQIVLQSDRHGVYLAPRRVLQRCVSSSKLLI